MTGAGGGGGGAFLRASTGAAKTAPANAAKIRKCLVTVIALPRFKALNLR
jgi:hypothetical protein